MAKQAGMSIADLEKLLIAKKESLTALQKERKELVARLAQVDTQIQNVQGRREAGRAKKVVSAPAKPAVPVAKKAKPKKARRQMHAPAKRASTGQEKSLPETIIEVLSKSEKPQRAKEITEAVLAAGYKTKSKKPSLLVRNALYGDDRVTRAGRGLFQMKAEK